MAGAGLWLVAGCRDRVAPVAGRTPPMVSSQVSLEEETGFRRDARAVLAAAQPALRTRELPSRSGIVYIVLDANGRVVSSRVRAAAPELASTDPATAFPDERPADLGSVGMGALPIGEFGPNALVVIWAIRRGSGRAADTLFQPAGLPSTDRLRDAVSSADALALDRGLPRGMSLWFLVASDGRVLRSGRAPMYLSSDDCRRDLQARFPGVKIAGVTLSAALHDGQARPVPVAWAVLDRGSPAP